MTPGLAIFIAGDALGVASAVISCRRTSRYRGRGAAAREAVVLAGALAVYTSLCLAFGFGFWPQLAGCLFGGIVAVAGQPFVPPRAELFTKGDD